MKRAFEPMDASETASVAAAVAAAQVSGSDSMITTILISAEHIFAVQSEQAALIEQQTGCKLSLGECAEGATEQRLDIQGPLLGINKTVSIFLSSLEQAAAPGSSLTLEGAEHTLKLALSSSSIGGIIGRGGGSIKQMREDTSAVIKIESVVGSSDERMMTVTGTKAAVIKAHLHTVFRLAAMAEGSMHPPGKQQKTAPPPQHLALHQQPLVPGQQPLMAAAFYAAPLAPPAPEVTYEQLVPHSIVGTLIGKGGATIKELRELSGAKLKVEAECEAGTEQRKVTVSGAPAQAQYAIHLIAAKLGSAYSQAGVAPSPPTILSAPVAESVSHEQLVSEALVGRLIGKGGANIKQLREMTGTNIKINGECEAGTEQRKVTVTGTPAQVQYAVGLLQLELAKES